MMKSQGIRLVYGKYDTKNIFVLPANSDNVEEDSFLLRHLEIAGGMDEELKQLIRMNAS